jgi:hypothetical protein
MKSEAEIRRHRDNLRLMKRQPCGCRGTQHQLKCEIGLRMMEATEQTLSWILGEHDDMQRLVDELERDARDKINWPGLG